MSRLAGSVRPGAGGRRTAQSMLHSGGRPSLQAPPQQTSCTSPCPRTRSVSPGPPRAKTTALIAGELSAHHALLVHRHRARLIPDIEAEVELRDRAGEEHHEDQQNEGVHHNCSSGGPR